MWRTTTILLLLAVLTLATGIPQRLHRQQHNRAEACLLNAADLTGHRPVDQPAHRHSDKTCGICALLYAPSLAASPAVILIDAGTPFFPVTAAPATERPQTCPSQTSCRGPPQC